MISGALLFIRTEFALSDSMQGLVAAIALVGAALGAAVAGGLSVPGVILALGMLVLPETPRWLAGHGRLEDAENVLRRLRGMGDIEAELAELRTDLRRGLQAGLTF